MLLYRKENSELDFYCHYNVYLSYLYISRKNNSFFLQKKLFKTMYRNFNLFPFQPIELHNKNKNVSLLTNLD